MSRHSDVFLRSRQNGRNPMLPKASVTHGQDHNGAIIVPLGSFTLELLDSEIPLVLAEIRRALRRKGRLGVVTMTRSDQAAR